FCRSLIALKSMNGTGRWAPTRYSPMITNVKRILLRRSGTRNMFRRRGRKGGPGPPPPGGARGLGVVQGAPLPGGARAERQGQTLDTATCAFDRACGGRRERVSPDGQLLRELPASEDLHEALLGHEAAGPQRARVDLAAGVERLEDIEVHDRVFD